MVSQWSFIFNRDSLIHNVYKQVLSGQAPSYVGHDALKYAANRHYLGLRHQVQHPANMGLTTRCSMGFFSQSTLSVLALLSFMVFTHRLFANPCINNTCVHIKKQNIGSHNISGWEGGS